LTRLLCTLVAACVTLAIVPLGVRAAAGRAVTYRADDGRTLTSLLFEADQKPGPAVVLIPMLGRTKDDWQAVGQRLSEANITALAVDLPSAGVPADARAAGVWASDVRMGVSYLVDRAEIRASSVGLAGASLGATIAALEGANDPRIRSLALVSPSIDYRGIRIEAAMRQFGTRPAVLMASIHDPYAVRSAHELAKDAPGLRELQLSELTAHGTLLLAQDADLTRVLVDWFRRTLG
jgi:dienelactone hydrolase